MIAQQVARALGGRGHSAPCPVPSHGRGRGDRHHSLSVNNGADGRLLVRCHAGCDQGVVWAELRRRGLTDDPKHIDQAADRVAAHVRERQQTHHRRTQAQGIWDACTPAQHTLAEEYLRGRGIVIQIPEEIRFWEAECALVAAIRDQRGAVAGIQRIYLDNDPAGVWHRGKRSLGPISGGACWLTPAAGRLQITESVEDGLALLQLTGRATWACTGTSMMQNIDLPPEVREVILCPDADAAGRKAIKAARARLSHLTVQQLLPPEGQDWVDVLGAVEERAAIKEYDGGVDREEAENQSWVEAFLNG